MERKEDRAFMRQFSGVIAGFMVLTVALIFLARHMQPDAYMEGMSGREELAKQRVQPVGAVRSGEAGAAALAEAQQAAAKPQAAAEGPVDGESVYNGLCVTCHANGVAGAPIPGSDAFKERYDAKGLDGLLHSAINGLNAMPARGGNPSLTDEQIKAAIEFMLKQ
jgi:cytochrome c5